MSIDRVGEAALEREFLLLADFGSVDGVRLLEA